MKEKLEQRLGELLKTEAKQQAQIQQLDTMLSQGRAIMNMIQGRKAELSELIELEKTSASEPPKPPVVPPELDLNLPPLDKEEE